MRQPMMLAASLVVLIVSGTACSGTNGSQLQANTTSTNLEQRTDREVHLWVDEALRLDPRIAHPDRIAIEVNQGIVKLTGTADSLLVKRFATLETEKIAGVRGVINELTLAPSSRSDDEIRSDIVRRLSDRPSLRLKDLEVDVSDGVATLRGTANSLSELKRVDAIVTEVQGVRELSDLLVVSYLKPASDEYNRDQIVAALDLDPYLTGLPITVKVVDGTAILEGTVGNLYERRRAEEDVWRVAYVLAVENELKTDWFRSRGTRDRQADPSDDQIHQAVRDALIQDLRIEHPQSVEVSVRDGAVSLQGDAENRYESDAIESDAGNVVGVKEVTDLIQIRPGPRKDGLIATMISMDLSTDYLLEDRDIDVNVHDGVATLSGTVGTHFEKEHAEAVAWRTPGVREVVDDLALQGLAAYNDAALADHVRSRLRADWETRNVAGQIQVRVDQGDATLTGRVDTWSERMEAGQVTAGIDGIRQVHNDLVVETS